MPLQSFDEIRLSAKNAFEKVSETVQEKTNGRFSLMKTSEEEADEETVTSEASSRMEELTEAYCPKLTFQQRLIGFGVSFGIGYLITFMSFKFFIELIEGRPVPFAVNYSVGNTLSLMSMTFLCGPRRQFLKMFDEKRKWTSITYLSCLVSTLVFVFIPLEYFIKLFGLMLLIMVQFCASVWYSLSYIPFGRRTALRMVKKCIGWEELSEV